MKASLLANLAFLGLFSLTQVSAQDAAAAVSANDNKDAAASATKQYIVSFEDEVTSEDFESVRKWIKEHNGEVVEAINENFAKLIIAKMDDSIMKLDQEFPNNIIESIEEDNLEWDNDEHDEL